MRPWDCQEMLVPQGRTCTAQRDPSSACSSAPATLPWITPSPQPGCFPVPSPCKRTGLRLQGQGKGTDIQLGTATPASSSSHQSSPGSLTAQACLGWSMPLSPSEKGKLPFLREEQVTSGCLVMPCLSPVQRQVPESLQGQKPRASTSLNQCRNEKPQE